MEDHDDPGPGPCRAERSRSTADHCRHLDRWCPWCYIGESRLIDAIEAEGLTGQVHLRAHSFELDPTSPTDGVKDSVAHLVEAKGMPEAKVREMESQIQQMAQEMGREYVIGRPMANTRAGCTG